MNKALQLEVLARLLGLSPHNQRHHQVRGRTLWGREGSTQRGGYGNKVKAREGLACCWIQAGPCDENLLELCLWDRNGIFNNLDNEKMYLRS